MKLADAVSISAPSIGSDSEVSSVSTRQEAVERRAVLAAVKELDLPELSLPNRGLNISFDRETKQSIVQVVDRDSGEVVQQIPGKEAVERARYYRQISGL